jgi:hypothetical protein
MVTLTKAPAVVAAQAAPPDLRARLADARGEVVALMPAIAAAVAVYRDALTRLVEAIPSGTGIYDVDEALDRWATESGARDLSGVLSELGDLTDTADAPAQPNGI